MSKWAFTFVILLVCAPLAFAGQSCATATVVPTDGRIVDFDFVAAGSTNFYQFGVTPGRSYSAEVREDYDDPPSTLVTKVNSENTACTAVLSACSTAGASGCTHDTHSQEPAEPANATRASFTVPSGGSPTTYSISVQNGGANGRYVSVSVSETTLYSPSWTSILNFYNAFTLANTTSTAVNGTLSLYDSTGALKGSSAVTMPVGGGALCYGKATATGAITSTNCTTISVAANLSGFVTMTHDGPPGAVQAANFTQNFVTFGGGAPFIQPIDFKPVRGK